MKQPPTNPSVHGAIVERLIALPAQEEQMTALAWARVVRALPNEAWCAATARRVAQEADAHYPELRTVLLGVAARFDDDARATLGSEVKAGSLNALSAFGDVRQLATEDAASQIEELAKHVGRQIQDAEAGHFGVGGHDMGSALAVLNAWHPDVAMWPPLLDLLSNGAVAKDHKERALESLASLADQIPDDIKARLGPIATAIAEETASDQASLFDDGRDLAGQSANLAVAVGADPAWSGRILLHLLSGPAYHRYWATLVAQRLKRPQDTGILVSLTQDPSPDVRAGAAAGLASLVAAEDEDSFAAQALGQCLNDPGRKVPATIAVVLSETQNPGRVARDALERLCTHRSAYVRSTAGRALS